MEFAVPHGHERNTSSVTHRCPQCREDALVYTLNRIPARYVATPTGSVVTEVNLEKHQSRAAIEVAMMEALRKVSMAPRCENRARSTGQT